ncbi:hypothetical protein FQZ97_952790 [compost metagenome]
MMTVLMIDRRATSSWMVARARTANSPGPDISIVKPAIPGCCVACAKRSRISSTAADCPSVSEPSACVCTSSMARSPSREAHTPSISLGCTPPPRPETSSTSSPVGSRARKGLNSSPADELSRSMLLFTALRRPSTLKRSGVTAVLSR